MDRKGRAGDGSCSRPTDGQGQGSRLIIQHAGRWTGAGQEIEPAAGRQMDSKGRAGDRSCSMPADGQRQGRRLSMQQADRWTVKAGQEIEHAAG